MALTQASSQVPIESSGLDARQPVSGAAPQAALAPRRVKRSLGLFAAAGFAVGLLLVVLLGLVILPMDFSALAGWQSNSADQRAFITMVADKYWLTKDATRLQKNLAGWNRDELNQIIVAMKKDSPDPQSRQRLAALAQGLHLPGETNSLTSTLTSQPIFWFGVILAIIPLTAAGAMVVIPRVWKNKPQVVLQLGALTAAESPEGLAVEARLEEEIAVDQVQQEATSGEKKEGEAESGEKKEEVEIKASAEESQDQDNALGDLASLFDDNEESSISLLEALCKGLKEIAADELVQISTQVLADLRQGNKLHATRN